MFEINDCRVRLARPEDKAGLIEISRHIWDGHDYLPKIVDSWIAEPWFYVCEYHGKIIACLKLSRFPDKVLWFEGLRVHKDFQGKGVAKLLNQELMRLAQSLKAEDPALSFEFCTYYKNVESLALTAKLGSRQVAGFFSMEKHGVYRVAEPEFVSDFGMEIFVNYPSYLPLNWHAVHNKESSLEFIRSHARVFRTPRATYLVGTVGERCITLLDAPMPDITRDLPYFQYFFGIGKRINVTLSSSFEESLEMMKKFKFYFWEDDREQALNMLVFTLPGKLPSENRLS
jgi:GNAT superfamily N-acetyltransferase